MQTFSLYPGHLSDSVSVVNPNPVAMTLSWEAPGAPFGAPSLASIAAWGTGTATASHSGAGGDATVETDANNWSLPNGAGGQFGVTYEYSGS